MKLHSSALEKLCYIPWNFQGQKPRLSWLPLEMPILSTLYSFNIPPRNFKSSTLLPVSNFFWNSSNCHATKIVIWLFGWNSPVHWAIPEKLQTGRVVDILFWNPHPPALKFLDLSLYLYKFWRKQAFTPGNSAKLSATSWKFQGQKPRPKEISHQFFFKISRNSPFFLIGPWDFHVPFLQYPWNGNSMYWTLGPCLDFSRNIPLLEVSSVKL